ncbi:hypothetical protein LTR08_005374 [Meristemomyces frigidus]|nr:hypothetical protein LTR08_005374 [Meristemomyces frigidus]
MAIDHPRRSCTVVLHDDRVSEDGVLCGTNVLPAGFLACLYVAGAKPLYLVAKAAASNPDEISVQVSLAERFGLENRAKGTIELIEDYATATADHVELFFQDQHLSRADMWRIMQRLDSTVVYKGQKVNYLGNTAAEIQDVFVNGRNVDSAYAIQAKTKPIFRSGSARYTILLQVSKEMLEGWVDGDLMYERVLSGYLPELFRRWEALRVRHEVSVVLFGRSTTASEAGPHGDKTSDFFHVIAAGVPSTKWPGLLRQLKATFNGNRLPRQVSLAARGSMLEALHMAAMDFANDNIDPHLNSTGTSIIAITAGAGLFETRHQLLQATTQLLMGNSIGVDIVALSPQPLHPVPLFSYERGHEREYALPHWVDISYWGQRNCGFAPKWSLPEATTHVESVSMPVLRPEHAAVKSLEEDFMQTHDENTFEDPLSVQLSSSAVKPAVKSSPAKPTDRVKRSSRADTDRDEVRRDALPTAQLTASEVLPSASSSLAQRAKREALPPHTTKTSNRKISLGPKGLAPSRGVASTIVSTQHAQHGKDTSTAMPFFPNEVSTGVAQQIRQSLARRASQQSLVSRPSSDSAETTRPIDIGVGRDTEPTIEDPVSLIEQQVLSTVSEGDLAGDVSLSVTPRAKRDPFYPAMKAAEAEGVWTTSPWVTLLNPCNLKQDNMRVAAQYRKWQHVFPRAVSSATFKWQSMCSPAALPLTTENRPSLRELETYPSKKVRRLLVSLNTPAGANGARQVLDQLIRVRLTHGFQQAVVESRSSNAFSKEDPLRVQMSLGNIHHELRCLSDAEIQVVEYEQLPDHGHPGSDSNGLMAKYSMRLRTAAGSKTVAAEVSLTNTKPQPDWSKLDEQLVTGQQALADQSYTRMRLVLIPVEPSRTTSHDPSASLHGLSDEERRIDGIQKLTQQWQRSRWVSSEKERNQASLVRAKTTTAADADPNPLAIEYQTRDPSAIVNAYGPALTSQLNGGDIIPLLFGESELYHSSTFDVAKLVKQMQEDPPHGVELRDRRWFARLYFRCFRGDEMVNWLLRVFKDLHSRGDAIAVGTELMKRGVFTHVRHKHDFRDGMYFYQISSTHRTTDYPDTVSVFGKGSLRTMPSTPIADSRSSPALRAFHISSPMSRSVLADSDSAGKHTPHTLPADKKELLLSQVMMCNVSAKKSDQLEVVSLHYDRIHNPINCYHIQLEWVSTTAKLIREAIGRWAALVENHGLRLMQVPMSEACKLYLQHPLEHPMFVRLAVRPPEHAMATPILDAQSSTPRLTEDPLGFHKALLRKLDFVLDYESAKSFTTQLDVRYSYGRPDYEYTQFVHTSGLVLAQISGDEAGDFLLLPNRLASTRRPAASGKQSEHEPAEDIISAFAKFCGDETALKAFYSDADKPRMLPHSPFAPHVSAADSDVPPMQLPPHLTHRGALRGTL